MCGGRGEGEGKGRGMWKVPGHHIGNDCKKFVRTFFHQKFLKLFLCKVRFLVHIKNLHDTQHTPVYDKV